MNSLIIDETVSENDPTLTSRRFVHGGFIHPLLVPAIAAVTNLGLAARNVLWNGIVTAL